MKVLPTDGCWLKGVCVESVGKSALEQNLKVHGRLAGSDNGRNSSQENPLNILLRHPYHKRTHVVTYRVLRRSIDSQLRN